MFWVSFFVSTSSVDEELLEGMDEEKDTNWTHENQMNSNENKE